MSRVTSRAASPDPTATPKTTVTEPPPDLEAIHELLGTMRETLSALGTTFDHLGEQTARVARLGPAIDTAHQINQLRRQLQRQEAKQEERMREVEVLLRDVLKSQIAEHLSGAVRNMVRDGIQKRVKERVAEELSKQVPAQLKDQLAEHKKQLEDVRHGLFNSEARRANALLRSSHLTEPLHPLLTPGGAPSPIFPKDLATLFGATTSTARALLKEHGLPDPREDETRERMLNRFMSHIGVAFQMVPAPSLAAAGGFPLIAQA
ncbi:hypothetical protein AURDEDRAFT_115906 [Auricularia subglabra TFB-10046 SS5]|nr:hypothetical protein AURDEDRAFT_115906 [Auricularia subglabra TFB-10046 SS5]